MSIAAVEPTTGFQVLPSVEVSAEKKVCGGLRLASSHRTISTYAGEVTDVSGIVPVRLGTPSYVRHWIVAGPPGLSSTA